MTQRESLIALASFPWFGPSRIKLLVEFFGSYLKTWNAPKAKLLKVGLTRQKVELFDNYRLNFRAPDFLLRHKRQNIKVVTFLDESYPENLKGIEGAPVVLFVKGTIKPEDAQSVAIVGSRAMSPYGKESAQSISASLAKGGLTIVSGLARGVDTEAHKAALNSGGRTIAVLGSGLDRIYPWENVGLAQSIVETGGALVSEYPVGTPTLPSNFAARNRIISGLSKAVIVIEGAAKSGTLLTASAAAEQGRSVFAVPGEISSPLSAAPFFLLNNGARLFTSAEEFLEELKT
jgi:DNA processing protein